MGLIKAAAGAGGGVLADQWKEYFYCDAINADVLAVKGRKKVTKRSSNTKGDEDIITSGSVIAVADGQAMMIVDQGKVVEAAFEPGEFVYDSSAEPTIFAGSFGDSVCKMFANMAKRFTFGGEAPRTQRVYYFNTKELTGNKYGTASPVPFRVLDERAGIDMDIGLRCFGEYSYRIVNPMLFYTNVCGNMAEEYRRENLDSQLKSELLTALQPAFARIGANGVRYSALPAHTMEIADALNEQLSSKWRELRGIEIVSFGVNSVKADEEDEKTIKEMQREAAYRDPTRAAGSLVHAQAEAMNNNNREERSAAPAGASRQRGENRMNNMELRDAEAFQKSGRHTYTDIRSLLRAAVTTGSAISIYNDLTSCKSAVTVRSADYETSCRIDKIFCILIHHICRNNLIKNIFFNIFMNLLLCNIRIMLSRAYNCINTYRFSSFIIFYSNLCFSIWS